MPNEMITCPKCHGRGWYEVYEYDDNNSLQEAYNLHCEVCGGTGKITLEFYEEIQRKCRGEEKC